MNVVVRSEDGAVSLLVDEIGDVVEIQDDIYERPPETLKGVARELVQGVYKLKERLLLILDTEKTVTLAGAGAAPSGTGALIRKNTQANDSSAKIQHLKRQDTKITQIKYETQHSHTSSQQSERFTQHQWQERRQRQWFRRSTPRNHGTSRPERRHQQSPGRH